MSLMTEKEYLEQFGGILDRIRKETTPFTGDSTARKEARKKRARADKFFFAATYFPHYIQLKPEYKDVWKNPNASIDWVEAGFASSHISLKRQTVSLRPFNGGLFDIADLQKVFSIIAGYRECSKSTLLGKIDPIWKIVFEDRWYIPIVSRTEKKSESKVIPLKIEFEENIRLRNDFGDLVGKHQWENGFFVTNTGRAMKGLGRDQSLRGEEVSGHRYDHFIVDDISDPDIPDSDAVVKQKIDWFKKSLLKGVNSPRWSGLMLANWTTEDDITDGLMRGKYTEHFNKVIIRVLVPNDLETKQDREIERACKAAGLPTNMKSDWEFRHPTLSELKDAKDDPETHDCEKMMRPRKRKGKIFQDHWFKYHSLQELDLRKYETYTFVDPSATEPGDPKAVVTLGVGIREDKLHMPVLKADIQQESIDWMLETTWQHHATFKPQKVGVADNAYKDFVVREYHRLMKKKRSPLPFLPINQVGSKRGRIARLAPLVKQGIITFDPQDPDQELLMRQLKAEPNPAPVSSGGVGDDGSDALEGADTLVEDFPNRHDLGYETVQRREMRFANEGAY